MCSKRSGVNQVKPGSEENERRREVMTSHGFRKFFINQCDKAHLNYTTWKHLAGHKLQDTDASYLRKHEEDILAEYVKAIPLLSIDSKQRLQTRVKELESERSQEMIELRALKKEMDNIKYLLDLSNNRKALREHLEIEAWRRIQMAAEPEEFQDQNSD